MIETGQRALRRADHILALADALRVPPRYLADGWDDPLAPALRRPNTVPFPAQCDPMMLERHQQLACQFSQIARADTRAAGDWLRRLAREPTISPWLLLDQLVASSSQPGSPVRGEPGLAASQAPSSQAPSSQDSFGPD
jgi:hypothetical protein